MGTVPLISVCIPTYNGDAFIGRTLESVLNQTLKNFEVVVVDDHSTDRTVAVIEGFADPRINLLRNSQNLGLGANWNKAVSSSRGKYVKLLCGDDLLMPECLARQVTALEADSNSRAVLAVCNRTVIDARGNMVWKRPLPFASGLVHGEKLIRRSIQWGSNLVGEPAVGLFRREVLSKSVRFDPSNDYLIDLRFWADLLRHGDAFIDKDCLAAFRISRGAVSSRIGYRQAALFRSFIRDLRRDGYYRITWLDFALGNALSFQWCFLRNLFLHLHSARAASRKSTDIGDLRGSEVRPRAPEGKPVEPSGQALDRSAAARQPLAKSAVLC